MIALLFALFQNPAANPPAHVPAPVASEPAPSIEAPKFDGPADGLTQMQVAVGEGKTEVALALADAMLAPNAWSKLRTNFEAEHAWLRRGFDVVEPAVDALGLGGPSSALRGEVHYAAGVALDRGGKAAEAQARLRTALAVAGPGELRLDASYNVGAIALGLAERLREAQKTAPPPQDPAAQGADPLAALESAYRAARTELVERLRADWRDEDTRANLEFIQRRLREIAEQRKQQQEQQGQDPKQKSDSKEKQDGKPEDSKDSKPEQDPSQQEQQDGSKQDQPPADEKPKEQPKDQQGEPPQSDEQKPEEQKSEEQKAAEEQEAQKTDEQKPGEPKPAEQEERVLTREEVMRILSRLEEIEKEGRALDARLRRSRQRSAEKDW